MSRDDDALSWGGDEDPTLDVGTPRRAPTADPPEEAAGDGVVLPAGFTAVGRGSGDLAASHHDPASPHDPAAARIAGEPSGDESSGDESSADESAADESSAEQIGNAALIAMGILGGVYLLYTIGWIIGGLRLQVIAPALLVSPVAYVPAFWLAVLAPAIWFGATLLLTRGRATWLRFVWLVAGAMLLIPWPFVMIGAVGQ